MLHEYDDNIWIDKYADVTFLHTMKKHAALFLKLISVNRFVKKSTFNARKK